MVSADHRHHPSLFLSVIQSCKRILPTSLSHRTACSLPRLPFTDYQSVYKISKLVGFRRCSFRLFVKFLLGSSRVRSLSARNNSHHIRITQQPGIYPGLIWGESPQSLNPPLKFLAKITFSLLFTIYYL